MGRRKERRLAAMSNAGRRVKLDLFEELPGDSDGISAMEKVGGESYTKTQPELPNKGKKQQNPLSLLEQYSDDEMDEGSNEGSNLASAEDASVEVGEKKIAKFEDTGDVQVRVNELTVQKEEGIQKDGGVSFDSCQKLEKGNTTEMDSEHTKRHDSEINDTLLLHPSNDEQFNGAVVSGWKMVLHEESNQYYYWNIATGETSWDVTDAFAVETGGTSVGKDADQSERKVDGGTVTYATSTPSLIEQEMKLNGSGDEIQGGFNDNKEFHTGCSPSHGTSLIGNYSDENSSGVDLSSQLKELSESLLMRLKKNLKSWNSNEDEELKSKYALETEIRLGDIKALASHGSSLLPFWQHLEVQLKRLEADVDRLAERHNFPSISGAALEPVGGIENNIESVSGEPKDSSTAGEDLAEPIKPSPQSFDADAVTIVNLSPLGSRSAGNGIAEVTEKISRPDFPCEDADMDVEMEIEDTNPLASTAELQVSTNSTLPTQESTVYSVPPHVGWIPAPPLDNEPFPPPPPPDEPFPPPPPEDTPETSHPMPAYFDSVQAYPYPQQYVMSYAGPGLAYYGQRNTENSGSTLYTLPEGGLVPNYFDASSNLYGMVVNQVEPVAYYGSQNPVQSSVLAVSGEAVGSDGVNLEPTPQSLPTVVDADPCQGTVKPSLDTQASIAAPVAASVINSLSISDASTSAVAATAPSTSKGPPKAARSKKRIVAVGSTLRSNKKVSSLVDKWKAAKEEMDEEEEEPDPIEILERKRHREIEEWKAQQIASGEAKDNANFQPLGGDWRERVKRKRAERMKEAGQSSSTSAAADGIQQPHDLVELSKGLPSGWQAYWDESSKQIYYGNKVTSETSWDRPA